MRIASQLHSSPTLPKACLRRCISNQPRSYLSSRSRDYGLTGLWSHLNPGYNIHMPSPSKLYLTLINVHIFASHINPWNVSPPSRSWKYPQIHPVTISNTSRFEDVQLTSTQVLSHLHLSPYFTHVPSQASIQVHISPSHFHQGCVWIPSSSPHSCLTSI